MRVQDLLENEEDFPIIYDIVKAKVEAGGTVYLKRSILPSTVVIRKIYQIHPGHTPGTANGVFIHFLKTSRQTPKWATAEKLQTMCDLNSMKKWKLTKEDDYWELTL
jgi:hypothetical protein